MHRLVWSKYYLTAVTAIEDDSPASEEASRNKELRRNLREEVERQVAKALSDNPASEHT